MSLLWELRFQFKSTKLEVFTGLLDHRQQRPITRLGNLGVAAELEFKLMDNDRPNLELLKVRWK